MAVQPRGQDFALPEQIGHVTVTSGQVLNFTKQAHGSIVQMRRKRKSQDQFDRRLRMQPGLRPNIRLIASLVQMEYGSLSPPTFGEDPTSPHLSNSTQSNAVIKLPHGRANTSRAIGLLQLHGTGKAP